MKKICIFIVLTMVLMVAAYTFVVGKTQPQTPAVVVETPGEIVETPIETPVETMVEVETPVKIVEEPKNEVIVEPVQKEPVAIDPDTIPKKGFITYREIRDGIDKFFSPLLEFTAGKLSHLS